MSVSQSILILTPLSNYKEKSLLTLNQIEPEGPGIFNFPVKDFGRTPKAFDYDTFIEYEKSIRKNEK